ncbi:MAG: hypothetical protein ACOX6T_02460 [Myxococcales bacterium]
MPTEPGKPQGPTDPGIRPPAVKFVEPRFELYFPDNLGRRPTSADIKVRKGLDGRSPEQMLEVVLGKSTGRIHESNKRLVESTILDVHKAFTIGVNNAFCQGSPLQRLAQQYPGANITLLGTLSAITPTVVKIEQPGKEPLYFQRGGTGFLQMGKQPYQVIMQAALRLSPPGVQLGYPAWGQANLAGPTSFVIEG